MVGDRLRNCRNRNRNDCPDQGAAASQKSEDARFIVRTKTLLVLALTILVLALPLVGQVKAHSLLVKTDPPQNASLDRNPSQVTLTFSEAVNPLSSSLKVLDSSGNRVDDKNVVFSTDRLSMSVGLPNLGKGVYTVSWAVVSAVDGHPTSGIYPFGVQEVVPPPPSTPTSVQPSLVSLIPEALARWTYYIGQTVLVGGPFFYLLVLLPWLRRRAASPNLQTPSQPLNPASESTMRVLIVTLLGALVAGVGAGGLILNQIRAGPPTSFDAFLFGTQIGLIGVSRLVIATASAVLMLLAIRIGRASTFLTLLLIPGSGLLLTSSLSGHNAAVPTLAFVSVLMDWLHLLGVSVWIGGLINLTLLIPILHELGLVHQGLARLVPRFSRLAILSVGIIAISGLYSALFQVGSFSALFGTEYGQTLIVKMGLTVVLVVFGALNQLVWYPRIARALKIVGNTADVLVNLSRRLSRSVRIESILAFGLILIVGLLTALPPAYQVSLTRNRPALQATTLSETSGNVRVDLSIHPLRVGTNSFAITLTNTTDGQSLTHVIQVNLKFTYQDSPLPPSNTSINQSSTGEQYLAQGGFLNQPGNWVIQVQVRQTTGFDTFAKFNLNLQAYPGIDSAKVWEVPYTDPKSIIGYQALVDGSGNIWFSAPFPGVLWKFVPGSNSYTRFSPPDASSSPGPIAFDSNGKLWYADQTSGSIAYFNTVNSMFSNNFPLPGSGGSPGGITVDSNGTIWVTDSAKSRVLAFNQTSETWISKFNLKTPTNSSDLGPIAAEQRGNIWFVGDSVPPPNAPQTGHGGGGIGKIEMLNVASHTILNFVPTSPNSTFLTGIAIGSSGDVWFAEHGSNRIGRITAPYTNASITQISLDSINPNAFPWGLTIDQRGNLWFTEHIGNKVAFYDVAKNQFQEWPIPTPQSDSKFVALDQFGNAWFAEGSTPTVSNLGVLALQPSAIGLVTSGPDYYYQFATVGGIVAIGVGTVAFFIRHRRQSKELAGQIVKPQPKKVR